MEVEISWCCRREKECSQLSCSDYRRGYQTRDLTVDRDEVPDSSKALKTEIFLVFYNGT